MSVIDTLISDRTQSDVDRVIELRNKILSDGLNSLSEGELNEYLTNVKGAYNISDINRVGNAINYLIEELNTAGYGSYFKVKNDWNMHDIPTSSTIAYYLKAINTIRSWFIVKGTTPNTPTDMNHFTYEKANDIERILQDMDELILKTMATYVYSNEIFCGDGYCAYENPILTYFRRYVFENLNGEGYLPNTDEYPPTEDYVYIGGKVTTEGAADLQGFSLIEGKGNIFKMFEFFDIKYDRNSYPLHYTLRDDVKPIEYSDPDSSEFKYGQIVVFDNTYPIGTQFSTSNVTEEKTKDEEYTIITITTTTDTYTFEGWKLATELDGEYIPYPLETMPFLPLFAVGSWNKETEVNIQQGKLIVQEYEYSGSEVTYTIPKTSEYKISGYGASGCRGNRSSATSTDEPSGLGAYLESTFSLNQGDILHIIVGGKGTIVIGTSSDGTSGGGGGGTFVFKEIPTITDSRYQFTKNGKNYEVLIVIAGGGGGNDERYQGSYTKGSNGIGATPKTPTNYTAWSTATTTGNTSSVLGINQYISYNLQGASYSRSGTATGGYGGGGATDDSVCSGGGWSGDTSGTYSFTSGNNVVGSNGVRSYHGSLKIEEV